MGGRKAVRVTRVILAIAALVAAAGAALAIGRAIDPSQAASTRLPNEQRGPREPDR